MGKEVHVVCDGVSSQQPYDREIALQRMETAGAFLSRVYVDAIGAV